MPWIKGCCGVTCSETRFLVSCREMKKDGKTLRFGRCFRSNLVYLKLLPAVDGAMHTSPTILDYYMTKVSRLMEVQDPNKGRWG
jgi:hypothetical protein